MIQLKKAQEHTIDRIFILALLALFCATAFLVVSIGAGEYRSIANAMTDNYETRTAASYLEEKINQNDIAGCVDITSVGEQPAISLCKTVNGTDYLTYIYCYDGYLWEITVSSTTTVNPGEGQKIIKAEAFNVEQVTSDLFCLTITDTANVTQQLYVSLNTKQ